MKFRRKLGVCRPIQLWENIERNQVQRHAQVHRQLFLRIRDRMTPPGEEFHMEHDYFIHCTYIRARINCCPPIGPLKSQSLVLHYMAHRVSALVSIFSGVETYTTRCSYLKFPLPQFSGAPLWHLEVIGWTRPRPLWTGEASEPRQVYLYWLAGCWLLYQPSASWAEHSIVGPKRLTASSCHSTRNSDHL
jgi:hypothetical protein